MSEMPPMSIFSMMSADDVGLRGSAGHGLFEGVQVNHHQVDLGNRVLHHLLAVALVVATGQDAAEHFRMQRLHASAQY